MNFSYKILAKNKKPYTTMIGKVALFFLCCSNLMQAGEIEDRDWREPAFLATAITVGAALNIHLHRTPDMPWSSIVLHGFRGAALGGGFGMGALFGERRLEWEQAGIGNPKGCVHYNLIDSGEIATVTIMTSLCMMSYDS